MNYQSPSSGKKIEKTTRSNFCCSFPLLLGIDKLLHFLKLFMPSSCNA